MVAAHSGGRSQSLTDELPLVQGAVAGVAAYVLGLVVTFLLLTIDSEVDLDALGQGEASTLDVVGWFFYSAHFVDIESEVSFGGATESTTTNIISEASTQFPSVVYHAVPIVLLIAVGFFIASTLDLWNPSASDVGAAGATVVVGYLPLALVGTFLFESSSGQASTAPTLLMSVLLLGVVFPLVLGAIGGVLSSQA
jgi:hypothetical protein